MEIRLLQNLDHPNIVKYLDSIRSDDYLNIILEFVENGSLSSLLGKFTGNMGAAGFPEQVRPRTHELPSGASSAIETNPTTCIRQSVQMLIRCSYFCSLSPLSVCSFVVVVPSSARTTSRRCSRDCSISTRRE